MHAAAQAPPLSRCSLVLPAEGTRVNLGIMYVRGGGRAGMSGVASVLWDVARAGVVSEEQRAGALPPHPP